MGSLAWEVIGVIDTEGDCAEWTFSADAGAVRTARAAVRGQLRTWELDNSVGDTAALLVSELVTNSLRHASGPIGLRLVRPAGLPEILLVEVSDPLPDPPRERRPRPEDESGRGLQLLASSSRRWGTRPDETGKTVWFELAVPSDPDTAVRSGPDTAVSSGRDRAVSSGPDREVSSGPQPAVPSGPET
ncbi:ATP-binding protein [Streptomyces mexicanus]|uniref:ATP-binding protein n=1 Tax=Streptomyces mexicanus TaxID=178566 RepID=A0A7X1I4P2_9ACTN|nr:ATP-binding protein [Streptomyces mexicanus]